MSTPRVPPLPPKGAGDLDKTAPTTEPRKVAKVEKIDEVDEDARAKQFRRFVDGEEETPSHLPKPFDLVSPRAAPSAPSRVSRSRVPTPNASPSDSRAAMASPAPMAPAPQPTMAPQSSSTASAAQPLPSPSYSPPPATYLNSTVVPNTEEEPLPLPTSYQFWQGVDQPADAYKPPAQPTLQETPTSASRIFKSIGNDEEEGEAQPKNESEIEEEPQPGGPPKKHKGLFSQNALEPSPFGPPGKSQKGGKEEILSQKKAGPEVFGEAPRENKQKKTGPEGVIAPLGKEGASYIGPIFSEGEEGLDAAPEEMKGLIAGKKEEGPTVSFMKEEEAKSQASRPLRQEEEEKKPISAPAPRTLNLENRDKLKEGPKRESFFPVGGKLEAKEKEERGDRDKKRQEKKDIPIQSPTLTPLPESVIGIAAQAAAAATPFLGPEALSIYFHMIGTITSMVSPKGDSRTEFILNSPSFAHSRFYGSTITIERFATAPYQLNIRLTGSNEAVHLFNQNIPNLLAAFQNGKYAFVINRIEAVYEKPIFRRKEGAKEKGDKGRDR